MSLLRWATASVCGGSCHWKILVLANHLYSCCCRTWRLRLLAIVIWLENQDRLICLAHILRICREANLIKWELKCYRWLLVRNKHGLRHLDLICVLHVTSVNILSHLLLYNGSWLKSSRRDLAIGDKQVLKVPWLSLRMLLCAKTS